MSFREVDITEVMQYWDRRPCNIRHSDQELGSKEYFDEVEKRKYFVEPHIPIHAEFGKWKDKKVLELGCGIGTDTLSFLKAGAQVTAVDLSERSLDLARQRVEVFGFQDRFNSYHGSIEELSSFVPVESYDLVYSFGVIHHTPNPDKVVSEIKKYMTPQASELRLMVYNRFSYKLFWIMKETQCWDMGKLDQLVAEYSEAQSGCPVTYTYTPETVAELLSGFTIDLVERAHIFTWDVDNYKNYKYVKDQAWENVSDEELAQMEKELGWHLLVHARLDVS